MVAPLQATQNQAISGIQGAVNQAQPGINSAMGLAQGAAAPITPQAYSASAVNQYMNPYTQDVVNATQNQFNQQNAQQQSGLLGNSASQGALGGDRSAILQAQLAGQQQMAQAPTIAGLYNQGFQGAQGEFNTQQGVGLQAAQANASNALNAANVTGNLAQAGQNSALTGNAALLNAGGLQQQVAQEQLNVPYEQYLQQQAYPYQNINFLSGILGGAAGATGATTTSSGTSSQTTPISIAKDGGRIGLASGGFAAPTVPSYFEREASRGIMNDTYHPGGLIESDAAGRTDRVPHAVAADSFVMPADVVSGIGQGNTLAGAKILDAILSSGPFGTTPTRGGRLQWGQFRGNTLADGGRTRLADGGTDSFNMSATDGYADPFQSASDVTIPGIPLGLAMAYANGQQGQGAAPITPGSRLAKPAGLAAANDDVSPTLRARPTPTPVSATDIQPTPSSDTPTWSDNGQPVSASATEAAGANGLRPLSAYKRPEENWGKTALAGLGNALAHRSIGAGILGAIQDYDAQRDVDSHPIVDDSGPTTRIYYKSADEWFDTGMPTEKSIANKNTASYQNADLALRAATAQADLGIKQGTLSLDNYKAYIDGIKANLAANPFAFGANGVNIPPPPGYQAPGATPSGQPSVPGGTAQGQVAATNIANNNVGNLKTPDGKGWQSFPDVQSGINAVQQQISRYGQRGINTVNGIVSTYAPASDHNDTAAYAADVASKLGVDPTAPLNMKDPNTIARLGDYMIMHEQGLPNTAALNQFLEQRTGQTAGAPAGGSSPPSTGPSGPDYLKTLPPNIARQVQALADGRLAFPSGFALRSPYWQSLMQAVGQYDPTFDAVNYNSRAATRRDFTSGKSAQTINALNTGLGHVAMLDQAGDALDNGETPLFNTIKNQIADWTGKPAPGNFRATAGLVAEELTRIYRQAGGSEADIQRHLQDLSTAQSPEQRRGALYQIGSLLDSKLNAMADQYGQGMGTTEDRLKLLNPHAAGALTHILSYGPNGTGPTTPIPNQRPVTSVPGQSSGAANNNYVPPPNGVPSGAVYSPSRHVWKVGNTIYDANGRKIAA